MKNKYLTKKRNVSKSRKTKIIKNKTMIGGSNGNVPKIKPEDQTLKRSRSGSMNSMKRERSGSTSSPDSHYDTIKPRPQKVTAVEESLYSTLIPKKSRVTPEMQKQRQNTNTIVEQLMDKSRRNGSDRYEKILPFMNTILSKIRNGAEYMHSTQKEIGIADALKNANLNPILKEKIAQNFSQIPKEQVEKILQNLQEVKRQKESRLTNNSNRKKIIELLTVRKKVNGRSQGPTRIQKIPEDVKNRIILMSLDNNSENKKTEINNLLEKIITTPDVREKMSNYFAKASLDEIQNTFNKATEWSNKPIIQ